MKRREFITLLGSAATVFPILAHAQQPPLPRIAFLRDTASKGSEYLVTAFRAGLTESGFADGKDVIIELGMSEGRHEQLVALAAEFAARPVSVLVTSATSATLVGKAATSKIPIVFAFPGDPVALGLVASMNRPGGNATGISYLNTELVGKRVQLLHSLIPQLSRLAILINPNGANAEETVREVDKAAQTLAIKPVYLRARTADEIDKAFGELRNIKPDAVLIGNDAFYTTQRARIVGNAVQPGIVTVYAQREFAEAGGLMSYGANLPEAYRLAGVYAARILKGERPAQLPIIQPTKFELIVNLKSAKALNLTLSERVLALADEVIE
jgi:putative tryptophan/tyrosine transport system substrate-binding protein